MPGTDRTSATSLAANGTIKVSQLLTPRHAFSASASKLRKPLNSADNSVSLFPLEVHSSFCNPASSRPVFASAGVRSIPMGQIVAILAAAGLGTRMGHETPKQFLELNGVPLVILSLRRVAACPLITQIIVATRAEDVERLDARIQQEDFTQPVQVVKGGNSRQASVGQALKHIPEDTELVVVHDAVRPLVTVEHITRVIEEARRCKAAILGIPAMDTVKEVKRASLPKDVALITATVPRERVVLAQTPQVFQAQLLKDAFARAEEDGVNASDEAGLVERLGLEVRVVHGSERNIKITKPADMELARFYLQSEPSKS